LPESIFVIERLSVKDEVVTCFQDCLMALLDGGKGSGFRHWHWFGFWHWHWFGFWQRATANGIQKAEKFAVHVLWQVFQDSGNGNGFR